MKEYINHQLSSDKKTERFLATEVLPFIRHYFGEHKLKLFTALQDQALRQVILNFLYNGADSVLITHLTNGWLDADQPYYNGYGMRVFKAVLLRLEDAGLLEIKIGKWNSNPEKSRATEIWLKGQLKNLIRSHESLGEGVEDKSPLIELRHVTKKYVDDKAIRSTRLIPHRPSKMTKEREAILEEYNALLKKTSLTLSKPCPEVVVNTNKKRAKCIFTRHNLNDNAPHAVKKAGGRIYGGFWVSFPKECRKHILINGQKTIELDFKAMQMAILYIENRFIPYENGENYDPYLLDNKEELRSIVKAAVNMLLNNDTVAGARSALQNNLSEDQLKTLSSTGVKCSGIINRVLDEHPIIAKNRQLSGLQIQFLESDIMLRILARATEDKIPVLSIHDSCIAAAKHEKYLRKIMTEEFHSYFPWLRAIASPDWARFLISSS